MELPLELKTAVEQETAGCPLPELKRISHAITRRYLEETGRGRELVTAPAEAAVYAAVRMPATYGAVSQALSWSLEYSGFEARSLLDVGAGTGAATWAASALLPLEEVTCLERGRAMAALGKKLMQKGNEALKNAAWLETDLLEESLPSAGLVIASYVLGEFSPQGRREALLKLWEATRGMLLLVEPGTPAGSAQLGEARSLLLAAGAHVAAPCPHEGNCPMEGENWCHFACRISRSRLHKQLKEGEAPFEDEKFSYLAVTREESRPASARILRHPFVEKGRITVELCTPEGLQSREVKKREAGLFQKARKAKWGDAPKGL